MLTPNFKRIVLQIIPFGVMSTVFSFVYALLEKGILGNHPVYPSTGNPYSFELLVPSLISFIVGLLIGVFEVLLLNKVFRRKSLSHKIFIKTILYSLIIFVAILSIIIISDSIRLGVSPFNKEIWFTCFKFMSDFAFLSILLYFALGITICLLYNEISDNIGQAVLINFFTGKYHKPIEEERIFMFLDMKSSTTIAEQLGHVEYFKMLNEYYKDLSDSIIRYGGEIYQYVGDEVVVTWKMRKGSINKSLNCFFAMKEALAKEGTKYQSEYGIVPTFKAAIHFGKVTTGEIGVLKKEIIYSGDVLNTTARIQGLCNKYEVDFLTSEKMIGSLETNDDFKPIRIEESELKGRRERINLYTIQKTNA